MPRHVGAIVASRVLHGVCHRGVANLRSKVSTIGLEEIASELRAVVGDDAVRDPEPAYEAFVGVKIGGSWVGGPELCI